MDWLTNGGGLLQLATTPLFWNPNWDFHRLHQQRL